MRGVKQELDKRCEDLMASKFGEKCDFDVEDALVKLEKLEIITKVSHLALDVHINLVRFIYSLLQPRNIRLLCLLYIL